MTQFIKTILRPCIILFLPAFSIAQSTFLPQGDKSEHFLDRIQIILQNNPNLNIISVRPISRKLAVEVAKEVDSLSRFYPYDYDYQLSRMDRYNLKSLLMDNSEWANNPKDSFLSKLPVLKTFYLHKANCYAVNEKDFFLALDPVLQQTQSIQSGNNERVFLNSKGLTMRGMIAGKLGFSAYLTDNQERGPDYFQNRVTATGFSAVPGTGYYQSFKKTAFDYFDNRASIYFNAMKYFDFQFGYDKNFIGDGYRSLFLSDYSAPYLFLKWNARVWKLNYQNILMELIDQHSPGNYLYPKKYSVIHDLGVNISPWLKVGLYENIVFSRANHFDFSYLNPVGFLVSAQQENGSADKTTVGLDFKANVGHVVQLYGQLVINEFILNQIIHYSRGFWANKQGIQLGLKYINAFGIKNLDFQVEANVVRPFTYSSHDTVTNYSNYNQPLAHPLGANFDEVIAIARYQPAPKWNVEGKLIYYRQGIDSAGENFGSNIFINYNYRPDGDYGYKVGLGNLVHCVNASVTGSYEFRENLFIDLSAQFRTYNVKYLNTLEPVKTSSSFFTLGIRLNVFRRQYDY